jgi:hypothetical protein
LIIHLFIGNAPIWYRNRPPVGEKRDFLNDLLTISNIAAQFGLSLIGHIPQKSGTPAFRLEARNAEKPGTIVSAGVKRFKQKLEGASAALAQGKVYLEVALTG